MIHISSLDYFPNTCYSINMHKPSQLRDLLYYIQEPVIKDKWTRVQNFCNCWKFTDYVLYMYIYIWLNICHVFVNFSLLNIKICFSLHGFILSTGAMFLQSLAQKYKSVRNHGNRLEDKSNDNAVMLFAYLYSFKVNYWMWKIF